MEIVFETIAIFAIAVLVYRAGYKQAQKDSAEIRRRIGLS